MFGANLTWHVVPNVYYIIHGIPQEDEHPSCPLAMRHKSNAYALSSSAKFEASIFISLYPQRHSDT